MNAVNDSETGRLRRKSEATGEKESQSFRQFSIFVGARSQPERFLGKKVSFTNASESGDILNNCWKVRGYVEDDTLERKYEMQQSRPDKEETYVKRIHNTS